MATLRLTASEITARSANISDFFFVVPKSFCTFALGSGRNPDGLKAFAYSKDVQKRTCAKALVMTHAYSNAIMDKVEEAVKNGLIGNEDDDW